MKKIETYIKEFKDILIRPKSCQSLYKNKVLNQKSNFDFYAQCLLDMPKGVLSYFDGIQSNEVRDEPYKVESHCGVTSMGNVDKSHFKWEERECIAFYNYFNSSKQSVKILDYQIPLKNTANDKEDAIDLLGTDGKDLIMFEYKRFDSSESLLRSLLEIYTYKKLLKNGEKKILSDYNCRIGRLVPAVIFMEGSSQHSSFKGLAHTSATKRLFKELDVRAYLIKPSKVFSEDDSMKLKLAMEKPELNFDMEIVEVEI